MIEADYGYWGFSPSSDPFANYREYGVDALGLNPEGYFSDHEKTNYDAGFGECRAGDQPEPGLRRRRRHPARAVPGDDARARGGLRQPVAPGAEPRRLRSGRLLRRHRGGVTDTVAKRYLSLDQAMVMGAIGNVAAGGVLRRAFSTPQGRAGSAARSSRMEEFGAGTA